MITKSKNNVVYVDNAQDEMAVMKEIVERKQFAMIKQRGSKKGELIDLFSASTVMAVYNALNPENKKKLESVPLVARVNMCYKLTAK